MGDWEGDTIVGKGPARLVTLVDRKSGWVRLHKVPGGTATAVAEAVASSLKCTVGQLSLKHAASSLKCADEQV